VLQYLPAQTTKYVNIATGDDTKLYRQLIGRAHSGHATAAAFGRENWTQFRERRVWEWIIGIGTGTTTVTRAPTALGCVASHTEGHGKSKYLHILTTKLVMINKRHLIFEKFLGINFQNFIM